MAKYIISPQAKVDIAEILEYIAEDDLGGGSFSLRKFHRNLSIAC